jgi:hypothetical protein
MGKFSNNIFKYNYIFYTFPVTAYLNSESRKFLRRGSFVKNSSPENPKTSIFPFLCVDNSLNIR